MFDKNGNYEWRRENRLFGFKCVTGKTIFRSLRVDSDVAVRADILPGYDVVGVEQAVTALAFDQRPLGHAFPEQKPSPDYIIAVTPAGPVHFLGGVVPVLGEGVGDPMVPVSQDLGAPLRHSPDGVDKCLLMPLGHRLQPGVDGHSGFFLGLGIPDQIERLLAFIGVC
jgi:hypothetical protein